MNPDLDRLQAYPFERLRALKADLSPPTDRPHIPLSIGEPRHPAPALAREALSAALDQLSSYPATRGEAPLRIAIAEWLQLRYGLPRHSIDPERQVLPVNGTREALFAFAQAVVDRSTRPLVAMPNPFYQIYEGAALLAGAEPYYINAERTTQYHPDFDAVPEAVWDRCQLLYLCSPGNPTGAVLPLPMLQKLIRLAERHDFIIAADECYSEIYFDEAAPPAGLLEAAAAMGLNDYRRCVVFHSLSKRSNLPGLRSGFVAGDARILESFHRYRTYHGSAMPPHHQQASLAAWGDEAHVQANRALYRAKFDAVLEILGPVMDVERPEASFYLWARTPSDDLSFTRALFGREHITVLPGRYLSREARGTDPGHNHVRMALVAPLDQCVEAAHRIRRCVEGFQP